MKKSFKTFAACLLVAAMSMSILAGCSASAPAETQAAATEAATTAAQAATEAAQAATEAAPAAKASKFAGKTLKLALFEGGYGMEVWDDCVAAFQAAYPDVTIEVQHNPQIADVIRPQMIAGEYPDLIYFNGDNDPLFRTMMNEKQLWDMTDWYKNTASWDDPAVTVYDQINDGILDSTACQPYRDGKIYLAPYTLTSRGIVYNRTLWEKNGWKFPETWDELFAILDEAKAKGIAGWTYPAANAPDYIQNMFIPSLVSALGAERTLDFVDYDETVLDTPEFKQLLDTYAKLGDYLLEGTLGLNHTESQAEFMQDKCLFIPNGDWVEGEMADAPRTENFVWGMAAPPVYNAGEVHYSRSTPGILVVPANAENPELGMEFLRILYSKAGVEIWAKDASKLLAVKGASEVAAPFLTEGFTSMHEEIDNTATAFAYSWTPIENSKVSINDVLYKTYADVITGKLTTEDWLNAIKEAFKEKNANR